MIRDIITVLLFSFGFLCTLLSAVGVLRFPTFLQRLHASGVGETMGITLFAAGFIVHAGAAQVSVKIVLIVLAMLLVNPVGTHLIGKAELHSGLLDHVKIREEELRIPDAEEQPTEKKGGH
jgi:multicomponent Na+:H+ antiporter subunit G